MALTAPIQSNEGEVSGPPIAAFTSLTVTFSGTPANGNTIVLDISVDSPVVQNNVLVPSGWTQRSRLWDGTVHLICTRVAGAAEPTGVTVSFDGTRRAAMVIYEVDGLFAGAATPTTATGTSQSIPSITPETGVEALLVASMSAHNAYGITTQPSGYTSIQEIVADDGGSERLSTWYKHVASTSGSYTGSATYASSVRGNKAHVWFTAASPDIVAAFSGTPLSGDAPLEVTFTDESTGGPDTWAWDFGDGVGTSTSQNPVYEYTDPGTYTVSLTASLGAAEDTATIVAYVTVTDTQFPFPGVFIDWDNDGFGNGAYDDVTADVRSWTIHRGVSGDLAGQSGSGGGTLVLNDLTGKYNPENAASPIHALLRDGPRVWIGVNEDGTIAFDAGKTVHGIGAGRITDITPIPVAGADDPPTVEITFEDPLAWIGRTHVTIEDSTTRSQVDLRSEVIGIAMADGLVNLCDEPTTMPLSSADGLAGNILDALNKANGTRHFAKPADDAEDWFTYTTVRRTSKLDGVADASVDAGADHVTGTSGWRKSADTVVNQQRATVEPVYFTIGAPVVWEAPTLPFVLTGSREFWMDFDDYVQNAVVDISASGAAVTSSLTPFGESAKLVLTSAGTSTVASLTVQGNIARRGLTEAYVVDDTASQAAPRGVRAGPDLSGDLLGIGVSAYGMAAHIVWRFGSPLLRPDVTIANWFPDMFERDLLDLLGFTSSQLSVSGRLFEIVGLTHHGNHAAPGVVHHVVDYQLQESKVQEATSWFTWDVSEWDDATSPWAY